MRAALKNKEAEFKRAIRSHFRRHRRDLPWRRTRDPYRILVSELMLQQTQVERVIRFYDPFLKWFPTSAALARATLAEVLAVWQGLGYNRRAKFLRAAAQRIMMAHNSKVPHDETALTELPGVGRNTAGAIRAFAFNEPAVFIETNIRRAFIHHFFPRAKRVDDAQLLLLIERTLDRKNPREWYYALMDYGAALGRDRAVANPNRRSRAYKKQAAFEGSVRKVRGAILRVLLAEKRLSRRALAARVAAPEEQYKRALAALEKEKFLTRKGADILLY